MQNCMYKNVEALYRLRQQIKPIVMFTFTFLLLSIFLRLLTMVMFWLYTRSYAQELFLSTVRKLIETESLQRLIRIIVD